MVKRATANGARIKELRLNSLTELPQKRFAERCQISERHLRRIENENPSVPMPVLQRIAQGLGVGVDDIAYGMQGPELVRKQDNADAPLVAAPARPETIFIPRYRTTSLSPIANAQALYELAENSMAVIPHVLVDAPSSEMVMIKECLSLLKAVSDRRWSLGSPPPTDAHDDADFPEVSRRSRLAELFVLIKGHDIRIVAGREDYRYPPGATPWLVGQTFCFQLIIGFAPPRGEYEEESVAVPFDGGTDITLPYKPLF